MSLQTHYDLEITQEKLSDRLGPEVIGAKS